MLSLVLSEVKSLNAVMWLTQLKAIAYGEDDRTSHKSGGEDHLKGVQITSVKGNLSEERNRMPA